MTKIGRNDTCPCGSGKKYKHCCLAQDRAYQNLLDKQSDAKLRAVEWLTKNYGEAVDEAVTNAHAHREPAGTHADGDACLHA